MKKLLLIPVVCFLFLFSQGSKQGQDFTYLIDSVETGDTVLTISVVDTYGKKFNAIYFDYKDTGATYTDSAKVYAINERGDESQIGFINGVTNSFVTIAQTANATTSYKLTDTQLYKFKIVLANAQYIAGRTGYVTIRLGVE